MAKPKRHRSASQNTTRTPVRDPISAAIDIPMDIPGVRFVLPCGVLKEDVCIIDEQEHHVVLTVRVPLDLIRNKHALWQVLSEMAKPTPPAEPEGDLAA
jgi:hypothetical protein